MTSKGICPCLFAAISLCQVVIWIAEHVVDLKPAADQWPRDVVHHLIAPASSIGRHPQRLAFEIGLCPSRRGAAQARLHPVLMLLRSRAASGAWLTYYLSLDAHSGLSGPGAIQSTASASLYLPPKISVPDDLSM